MQTVRAFIALELTSEFTLELAKAQGELASSNADVKWVNPEGIHLTLKFLGSISLELAEEVKATLDEVGKKHKPFKLILKGLKAFPKIEYPRVIWAGIEDDSKECMKLAQDLEEHLIKLGFLPEKRSFKAHLTLGRVRSSKGRDQLIKLLRTTELSSKTMQAKELTLFQSTLTPKGAIYQALHKVHLL